MRILFTVPLVVAAVAPSRAHAFGFNTDCRESHNVHPWAPRLRAVLAEGVPRCVWSFNVNGTDVWWQTGRADHLVAQVHALQQQFTVDAFRDSSDPTALVRLHEGRPTVRGMGSQYPDRQADWRMALEGRSHQRFDESLPSGETERRFERYTDGRRLVAFQFDVWLWRLKREDLQFPDGVVVEVVSPPEPAPR